MRRQSTEHFLNFKNNYSRADVLLLSKEEVGRAVENLTLYSARSPQVVNNRRKNYTQKLQS
jgi:hypothetical protein